jgi:hypothetical protein
MLAMEEPSVQTIGPDRDAGLVAGFLDNRASLRMPQDEGDRCDPVSLLALKGRKSHTPLESP